MHVPIGQWPTSLSPGIHMISKSVFLIKGAPFTEEDDATSSNGSVHFQDFCITGVFYSLISTRTFK